jgi:hypothetical protein
LTTTCCYDYIHAPPAMALVEPSLLAEFLRQSGAAASGASNPPGSAPLSRRSSDILTDVATIDITAAQVMDLLSSRGLHWRDSAETYFRTTHPWLSIVHPAVFDRKVALFDEATDRPDDVDVALLLVCMHLVTEGAAGDAAGMLRRPLFLGARRIWAIVKTFARPSIELIQCGILFSLYEYGHGDMPRAYMTLGEAATMARLMNVRPGRYVEEEKDSPVDVEEEQLRVLYWGLFIMDK